MFNLPTYISHLFQGTPTTSPVRDDHDPRLAADQLADIDAAVVEELLRAKRLRNLSQRRLRQGSKRLFPCTRTLTHSGTPA